MYTALGDEKSRANTARALQRAAPFLRRQLGARLRLKRAPELKFVYDESVAGQDRIEQILHELQSQPPRVTLTQMSNDPQFQQIVDAVRRGSASSSPRTRARTAIPSDRSWRWRTRCSALGKEVTRRQPRRRRRRR